MKKAISRLLLIILPAALLFSCKKDNFSEKDALDAQQTVAVAITVVDASSASAPVQGAVVKMLVDSTFVSKTTNADGTVVFTDVQIGGSASVSVTKDQYTSVITTVNVQPDNYRQTRVSATINLYALASAQVATIKGRLTFQGDLTDRDREPAVGVVVKARNSNLTQQLYTATTDNNGVYSVSVPVSSSGDEIQVFYPPFTFNQKLAFVQDNRSIAVAERSVLYNSESTSTLTIPSIPSVLATIAPASSGTGFTLGAKANRVTLGSNSQTFLVDGGSGYNAGGTIYGYQLSFSNDPSGAAEKLSVDIVNGKITRINGFVGTGATYSTAPTLDVNALAPTTPATITFNFVPTYKVYISNKGTGYIAFPQVNAETETFSNTGMRVKKFDANINDNVSDAGFISVLPNNAVISNGQIKSKSNGDTLILATLGFSSAPVFTTIAGSSKAPVLTVTAAHVNADSTLNGTNIITDGGTGYSQTAPPPVTLTTLAGYGSGAVARATVNSSGSVDAIIITTGGSRYVKNVNDFRRSGYTGTTGDAPSSHANLFTARPGDQIVQDVYYGTGSQILNQNTGKK